MIFAKEMVFHKILSVLSFIQDDTEEDDDNSDKSSNS